MVNVTNSSDINVWFCSFVFAFRHNSKRNLRFPLVFPSSLEKFKLAEPDLNLIVFLKKNISSSQAIILGRLIFSLHSLYDHNGKMQVVNFYNGLAENFAIYGEDECQTATYFSSTREKYRFSAILCKLKRQYSSFLSWRSLLKHL